MKEIGGYLELEQLIHNEFYPDLIAVNSARYALLYLLKARSIDKLYLPYFLCDSVSSICSRYGYSYEFYSISSDFLPIFEKKLEKNEYLYIVNFYGQLDETTVLQLKDKHCNIILDNAQSFFTKPIPGIDTIYSCRKFFGVPDGGYLATAVQLEEMLEMGSSRDHMKHLLGRFESSASAYYSAFKLSEDQFHEVGLKAMSQLTHNILGAINYDVVQRRRNENYAVLSRLLGETNMLRLKDVDGPYCYPYYYHKNGMVLKQKLAKENIYVPTLWPNVRTLSDCLERDYAENILPLPCDQRYNEDDMVYICKKLLTLQEISNADQPISL